MELLDIFLDGLEQIASYVMNIEKRTYWVFLITSAVIAFFVYRARKYSVPFLSYIFNKKVWLGRSAFIDYGLLVFNAYLKILFLGAFAIYGLHFAYSVTYRLELWFGQPINLTSTQVLIFYSISLALAKDFAFFIVHYASHKIPLLWEFHKIHHSATELNPFTQYRLHPFEMILNNGVSILVFGFVTGVFDFLSDSQISEYTLYGVGLLSLLFLSLGANLRHSHVKLRYPPFLEKLFISPFQHQIHHSNNPKHFNKNLGGKFAIWDLLFGTLVRSKDVQEIHFGLGDEDKDYDTLSKNLIFSPIKNIGRILNPFHKKKKD